MLYKRFGPEPDYGVGGRHRLSHTHAHAYARINETPPPPFGHSLSLSLSLSLFVSVPDKVRNQCVRAACREGNGAGAHNPGKGDKDSDCCGAKGDTGCDVGYIHSIMNDAGWAKIGGRTAGFSACNTLSSHVGNTCCIKGLDVSLTMGLEGDTQTHALTRNHTTQRETDTRHRQTYMHTHVQE